MFYELKTGNLKLDDVYLKEVTLNTEDGEVVAHDTYFLSACYDELLKELGFARVETSEFPTYDDDTQEVEEVKELDEVNNIYKISYRVVPKSLESLKELKAEEINAKRDEAINSGVSFKGKVFQSAERDRNLLSAAISLYSLNNNLPPNFVWIAKDNTQVPMNLQELIELGSLMAEKVNENTIKARNLKNNIKAVTSTQELELIVWE
ncbi:DUF4376 domain-containing protein [Helicobacter apodemus]|uniref:DUF4376 domain-containing protein n=1 Tax=Helicobacter apodemus TaxID=135569 RepID=A0A4U8UBL6_9HELI|nr:DUF4376 domain-containing protein [Helicobacter apodemus]TLE13942.1 DUF4376 domain-containing protein [Helicobacter apodemus]